MTRPPLAAPHRAFVPAPDGALGEDYVVTFEGHEPITLAGYRRSWSKHMGLCWRTSGMVRSDSKTPRMAANTILAAVYRALGHESRWTLETVKEALPWQAVQRR